MSAKAPNIYKLIEAAGSPKKLAIRLRMHPRKGAACIAQWKKRGVPKALGNAYSAVFKRILAEAAARNKDE